MKALGLYTMALFYVLAGCYHFIDTGMYVRIMPDWLPWHTQLVYISGACEILLGSLLLPERTRRLAAWGIVILLVAIFPANIQMMLDYRQAQHPQLWITLLRLPLQFVLIGWALKYAR